MYDPQPGYGPPPQPYAAQRAPFVLSKQMVAIAFGVVALAGMLCTLLPMWTLTVNPADFQRNRFDDGDELGNSLIKIHLGFYDWITKAPPVFALIPLALAVAVAVALIQIIGKGADRLMWGASAVSALFSLVLTASVAIRPSSAAEVTGPLARELGPRDLPLNQASSTDIGYGPGLIIALITLVAICGIAAWQYVVTSDPADEQSP